MFLLLLLVLNMFSLFALLPVFFISTKCWLSHHNWNRNNFPLLSHWLNWLRLPVVVFKLEFLLEALLHLMVAIAVLFIVIWRFLTKWWMLLLLTIFKCGFLDSGVILAVIWNVCPLKVISIKLVVIFDVSFSFPLLGIVRFPLVATYYVCWRFSIPHIFSLSVGTSFSWNAPAHFTAVVIFECEPLGNIMIRLWWLRCVSELFLQPKRCHKVVWLLHLFEFSGVFIMLFKIWVLL